MIWFVLAILGAFFDATYYALVKKNLRHVNQYVLGAGVFMISSSILFIVSMLRGLPPIGKAFYYSIFATVVLNIIASILYFGALKTIDLSRAVPIISFTPLFLILTSFLILGESTTILGIAGIVFIVIGSYFLNKPKNHAKLFDLMKLMIGERGILYMLAVAFLFSISSNFDKLVVLNSDAIFGPAATLFLLGVSFFVISFIKAKNDLMELKKHASKFLMIGGVQSLGSIAINTAFTMQIVSYVIALKRLSILFSVMYGGMMFKEKEIIRKIIGAVIILSGIVLIIFKN